MDEEFAQGRIGGGQADEELRTARHNGAHARVMLSSPNPDRWFSRIDAEGPTPRRQGRRTNAINVRAYNPTLPPRIGERVRPDSDGDEMSHGSMWSMVLECPDLADEDHVEMSA
jgi:hypothetical protein